MTITSDFFVEGVKRRISLPANQVLLSDDDILAMLDSVIKSLIVPALISVRKEFFVVTIDEATVADQAAYNVPYRAVGLSLRDLKYRRDITDETQAYDLVEIDQSQEDEYRSSGGEPAGYYFKNDQVIIVPKPSTSTAAIEIWHEQRPSRCVLLEEAAVVTAIASDVVSVETTPAGFLQDLEVDFIRGKAGHRILGMDKTIVGISGTDITFAAGAVPTALQVGDYLSLAGTSPVLQIPEEYQPLAETQTAKLVAFAIGDLEALAQLEKDEADQQKAGFKVVEPRNRGAPTKIVNRGGLLKGARGGTKRGYYR